MNFIDYKCLESLLIEGEEIANEGLIDKFKDMKQKREERKAQIRQHELERQKLLPKLEEELKKMLSNKEYKVYETFKLVVSDHSIDNFIDYLDQLVNLNNPKITILVGNKSENYDHLSENIETVFNDKIYRGIKIIYRNKVYDFSLSERNV